MDKAQLQSLIKDADDKIKDYSSDFSTFVKPIEKVFNFHTHNKQEFTNAYITTRFLDDYFKTNCGCKIAVRELPIKYGAPKKVIDEAIGDINEYEKYKKDFNTNASFSVDAYFDVDIDVVSSDKAINGKHVKYLFVEYKSSSYFKYLALAEDFIKYKIYTHVTEKDTAFVFLIFSKKEKYPTILKGMNPDYILLPKIINATMFDRDDKIFIYIPNNKTGLLTKPIKSPSPKLLSKVVKALTKVNELAGEIKDEELVNGKCFEKNHDFYVENIGALKNNVSTAKILTSNYRLFIKPLYDSLVEKGVLKEDDPFDQEKMTTLRKHFKNYERILLSDKKTQSIKDGLTTGYKSSLNALTLINVLNVKHRVGLKASLSSFLSETEKSYEVIDYEDILKANTDITIKKGEEEQYQWFDDLSKILIVFIVRLYETIFVFDDNGEYTYSSKYDSIAKAKRIQKLVGNLAKEVDYYEKIDIYSGDIEEKALDFFVFLYNSYFGTSE